MRPAEGYARVLQSKIGSGEITEMDNEHRASNRDEGGEVDDGEEQSVRREIE